MRPDGGEGRNKVLKWSWCACPTSEFVHGRLGFSRVIEEQSEGQPRLGEERRLSPGSATPCHVRKRAVLYAYGDVFVRSGEWPILVPFNLIRIRSWHIYLCALDGIDGTIEKTMRGNK